MGLKSAMKPWDAASFWKPAPLRFGLKKSMKIVVIERCDFVGSGAVAFRDAIPIGR
jgi:hypothetical protein